MYKYFIFIYVYVYKYCHHRPGTITTTAQGWGARPLAFFSPVQTGLPRELADSLTRATQPGLVSPGGSDQAQRYHPASLSSASGESLRHIYATLSNRPVSMVMRGPCACEP